MKKQTTAALTLAALGVVYGDIGTSPLYTVKEVFNPANGIAPSADNLIGAVSAIFWALALIVTFKYVILILRANNRGEGGVMALVALASSAVGSDRRRRALMLAIGAFGAAMFYGDSVITPAISVLSAVEGLEVMTPLLKPFVLPLAVAILVLLFVVQRFGTDQVGRYFGPIIALWFVVLAVAGVAQIVRAPQILWALDPLQAIAFLAAQGWGLFIAVGAIVLAVTGAEALYADLGHFGKRPIQWAWNGFVFPSLALNYMGQGALLMTDASALENPFYRLFPDFLLLPAVVLATLATIVASQAVISGAYSLTKQAIQLGFFPRMRVIYTSAREIGQTYLPVVNWVLLIAVVLAAIGFGSSSKLAGAYGIAVTLTMLATTLLTYFVVRHGWNYPVWVALAATGFFLVLDVLLVAATSLKLFEGGWFPIALGAVILVVMSTWQRGRAMLLDRIGREDPPLKPFLAALASDPGAVRVARTAVYPVATADTVPRAMLHNLRHNRVLHERNVILTVEFHDVPWIGFGERVQTGVIARDVWQVRVNYGFMNQPDIPRALELVHGHGLEIDPMETSYFLSRDIVVPTAGAGMAPWRERLFAAMSRNAGSVIDFFKLPPNAVIELGTRVQI